MQVYGTTIAKGKYAHQHVMALEDMSVTDVQDTEDALNGFQINHHKKSFLVYAPSLTDKSNWLTNLRKYIKLVRVRQTTWWIGGWAGLIFLLDAGQLFAQT